ncbi:glycosyltransferase family 2 protein [Halobaculum sp. MBLA0147]|uniref:glycosyltransferase family 2 protein n=1 Tax=Halobaculum sp. MBLA0147 TaxID=3079934 RepID=UPI00352627AF
MRLSVVVPTLNGRDQLAGTLEALGAAAPDVEVVVVNGPSADGTTGMVRASPVVDRLVEVSERNLNVARNAGLAAASGDAVALVGDDHHVTDGWADAVREALSGGANVVTGPCRREVHGGTTSESPERRTIREREVTYFHGDNVAFDAGTVRRLDGFDEYLETGGARDAAHRLAALDVSVTWEPAAATLTTVEAADGGRERLDWRWKYRALAYRLVKNYGLRPGTVWRTTRHAVGDALTAAGGVVRGESRPSRWAGNGRDVFAGAVRGAADGLAARARDRTPTRNPNGLSDRDDRAVAVYDADDDGGGEEAEAGEVGADEGGADEVGADEGGADEVGADEGGADEVGADEGGADEGVEESASDD